MRASGWDPRNGIRALVRTGRQRELLVSLYLHTQRRGSVSTQQKGGCPQARKGALTKTVILNFLASRTVRKKCLLFKSPRLRYSAIARADQDSWANLWYRIKDLKLRSVSWFGGRAWRVFVRRRVIMAPCFTSDATLSNWLIFSAFQTPLCKGGVTATRRDGVLIKCGSINDKVEEHVGRVGAEMQQQKRQGEVEAAAVA